MIHYNPVKKFLVTRLEIYEQLIEIEAHNELEARALVCNDGGTNVGELVYHSTMDSDHWTIEEAI